jgi:hypothetical protein
LGAVAVPHLLPARSKNVPEPVNHLPQPIPEEPGKAPNVLYVQEMFLNGLPERNRFEILESSNELQLMAEDRIAVKAGTLDENIKTFDLNINQVQWPGGVGVIFGYLNRSDPGKYQYHLIQISKNREGQYVLVRMVKEFTPDRFDFPVTAVSPVHEVTVLPGANRLTLSFEEGFLTRIDWNYQMVEELTAPVEDRKETERFTGIFGFYTKQSLTTFSDITIDGQPQQLIQK